MKNQRGFTLIELLAVIGIIGVLSSVVLSGLNGARDKGKISTAKSQLDNIRKAIFIMSLDTGLWPNGCPIGQVLGPGGEMGDSNEIMVNDPDMGLISRPIVGSGDIDDGCMWTTGAVSAWNGPYIRPPTDPWGTQYWLDADYEYLRDCPTPNSQINPTITAIVSLGPNKTGGPDIQSYDCDDIYIDLNN